MILWYTQMDQERMIDKAKEQNIAEVKRDAIQYLI